MAGTSPYTARVSAQYDAFVKKALYRGQIDYIREAQRLADKQTLFSELEEGKVESFADSQAEEAFTEVESMFQVFQYTISVRESLVHDALMQIDERMRNIILLAFWLEMSDQEIADEIGMKRRTVADIRKKAYPIIKKILEDDGFDSSSFFAKHK
jgi:RNA polymerase sigma factor (sigma-70 family)